MKTGVAVPGDQDGGDKPSQEQVFNTIGLITRMLHDAMRELGADDKLETAVQAIPDARARMQYIARMSGETAEKVIGQVEKGKHRQMALARAADEARRALERDPVQAVSTGGVLGFIEQVQESVRGTDALLTEILLAQSFHDLTTQAMDKVLATTTRLEDELVRLLLEVSPAEVVKTVGKPATGSTGCNGPVIDRKEAGVVTDQSQVDDLLESLGF